MKSNTIWVLLVQTKHTIFLSCLSLNLVFLLYFSDLPFCYFSVFPILLFHFLFFWSNLALFLYFDVDKWSFYFSPLSPQPIFFHLAQAFVFIIFWDSFHDCIFDNFVSLKAHVLFHRSHQPIDFDLDFGTKFQNCEYHKYMTNMIA
jgi:hypothetical protein